MNKSILVVDDDEMMRSFLSAVLREEGYLIEEAKDGKEGLAKFLGYDFDLVITDLKMPLVDGIDLIDIIKKVSIQLPIIIITAYGTSEIAEEAIKKGAYDFILKPFRKETILIAIKRALEWKRMQAELEALKSP